MSEPESTCEVPDSKCDLCAAPGWDSVHNPLSIFCREHQQEWRGSPECQAWEEASDDMMWKAADAWRKRVRRAKDV